jgi:hypothetical protein
LLPGRSQIQLLTKAVERHHRSPFGVGGDPRIFADAWKTAQEYQQRMLTIWCVVAWIAPDFPEVLKPAVVGCEWVGPIQATELLANLTKQGNLVDAA